MTMERPPSGYRPARRATSIAGPVEAHSARMSSEKVDIIVHCLLADGSLRHETNLASRSELRAFLQSPPSASTSQYLLSIEDISKEAAEDLSDSLHIQADFFKDHTRGRLNSEDTRPNKSALHSERLVSTLLGRASAQRDNYSLTWWKLSTHSLSQYSFEIEALTESDADATKIVVPHFNVQISNTRRRVGSTQNQVTQVKSGAKEFLRQWKKTEAEARRDTRKEVAVETICTLYSNTYRAHQVISEVKDNKWGSASEERLTYFKAKSQGPTFYVFLFDKARTLQENKQVFETDYTNARSWGILNGALHDETGKPITRMVREEEGPLIGTFLTHDKDEDLPASLSTKEDNGVRVPNTAKGPFVYEPSTLALEKSELKQPNTTEASSIHEPSASNQEESEITQSNTTEAFSVQEPSTLAQDESGLKRPNTTEASSVHEPSTSNQEESEFTQPNITEALSVHESTAATQRGSGLKPNMTKASSIHEESSASKSTFPHSTRDRFLGHITSQGPLDQHGSEYGDEVAVLRIKLVFTRMIAQDWDLVLSQMGQTLDDIDRKISDNTDLRKNVMAWRRLLGSWRMTIIEYKAKLIETKRFLRSQTPGKGSPLASTSLSGETSRRQSPDATQERLVPLSIESQLEYLNLSYEILEAAIKVIEIRVDKTFQALMSSMSILESQKAITQGSAVARLTELAFIFIPLNFACTFFSMQIQEFQGTSAPTMGAFFALAVPLMLFLYTLRAFIRSSLLRKIKHRLDTKIRETSKIPGTSEIPTRVIVSFGWRQLGPFSRALLIVVPLAIVILVLIIKLGHWLPFRIVGSVVTVIGTLIVVIFLAIESYVPALQAGAILAWILSMLSIGLGRIHPLNSAVMGALCTVVTTVFFTALAYIPQKITNHPRATAVWFLLPLWLVELPIAIIFHYYNTSKPRWELWVLLLAVLSVVILFGALVGYHDHRSYSYECIYRPIPQYAAIAAFSVGFPIVMVWCYAPRHGNHLPLYGSIIITIASVDVFFYLRDFFFPPYSYYMTGPKHSIFSLALCVLVAVPITLVWDTLPAHNILLRTWIQISVTCGSIFLFALFIALIPLFSQDLWELAALMFWASTAAWLPALLWAGHIDAFKRLTQKRTNTIDVTWISIIFWTAIWIPVYMYRRRRLGGSRTRLWRYVFDD